MKDAHFHEIIISEKDHRVISADAKAYGIICSDMYTSIEDYVEDDYTEGNVVIEGLGNFFNMIKNLFSGEPAISIVERQA